ncbi:hypothetical protein [Sphingobium sp. KCTC 72723]|uniref:hypothetical protein n=1 Tax=Sphingobium sp. KCTC 72723 TaxID=2733867 RepID=UPI0021D2FE73|nr:hypothetical protein [Sphingobium sp. KCTC 72723]
MIGCSSADAMFRPILPALVLVTLLPVPARASDGDSLMAAYRAKTQVVRPCDRSGSAIVVCGNRAERNARERLLLPREAPVGGVRGDTPRASAAPVRQGSCGVTGGQGGGCVGGLSLFKVADVLGKSVMAIIDPDADLAPPPPLPDRFKGTGQR